MKFTVEIKCDNAAFENDPASEIRRIVATVDIEHLVSRAGIHGKQHENLRDVNGNIVGHSEVVVDER